MIGKLMATRLILFLTIAALLAGGCDGSASADDDSGAKDRNRSAKSDKKGRKAPSSFKLGRIQHKAIDESSGLAASRTHAGVLWTHNDSGNGPFLFAITRDGKLLGEYPVAVVRNTDWEAIAADDEGNLYIGDVGNNEGRRDRIAVYRVAEPDPSSLRGTTRGQPVRVSATWRLRYADKPFDIESLFVHRGRGYVISKQLTGKKAGVYAFDLASPPPADGAILQHVCDLPVRSPVTDAAISADGERLAVLTVTGPNLFKIGGDVAKAAESEPASFTYFDFKDMNMEGICFVPEGLLATTEEGQILLFADENFK
jgi:hypothetical protein